MVWSNNETGLVEELNKLSIFADNPLVVEGKSYAAFDAISDKYDCEFKKRKYIHILGNGDLAKEFMKSGWYLSKAITSHSKPDKR